MRAVRIAAVAGLASVAVAGAVVVAVVAGGEGPAAPETTRTPQCARLYGAECMAKFDTFLLARIRTMSGDGQDPASAFDRALRGIDDAFPDVVALRRLDPASDAPVSSGTGSGGGGDQAVHYEYEVAAERGFASGRRTFCPGANPRIELGEVGCG